MFIKLGKNLIRQNVGFCVGSSVAFDNNYYRKSPKFLNARKLCCNLPKIQKEAKRVFHQKDANGIANSEDPNQAAPLGAV